jgi:glycine/D-amino acid oxidase-like deaminating enzyme
MPMTYRMARNPMPEGPVSWWFDDAMKGEEGDPPVRLAGPLQADVAIVGGGYTGLWAALTLKQRAPALKVAVLEAGLCGSQASGKNGGLVSGYFADLPRLVDNLGADRAVRVVKAGSLAQDALRACCEPFKADLWWRGDGVVKVSTAEAHDSKVDTLVLTPRELGFPDQAVALSREDLQTMCASPRFRKGVLFREGAVVHPARLVRHLRREAVRAGVQVFERSPARAVEGRERHVVRCDAGHVVARDVVLAVNAALTDWPQARPYVTNFSSYALMTEPAPDVLRGMNWENGPGISDLRMFLHYFRTTPDGRVLMGSGSGPLAYGGRRPKSLTSDPAASERAIAGLRWLFPALAGVAVAAVWGGAIDVASDHLPFFGTISGTRIHYASGYSGHGVNTSWIGGQCLASLVLDRSDEWSTSPFCSRSRPRFPPEPWRYLGGRAIRGAILASEQAEVAGRKPGRLVRFAAAVPRALNMKVGTR